MLSIFLLFLFSLPSGLYAQTAERPLKVVVEAGHNVTLPHLSGSHQTGHVTWLVETSDYGSASPDNFIFSGQKLCQFTDRTMVWPYYNLHFNCENYDLNLFWLKVENSAIYNVKNTVNASETNIYYDLRVVQIFPPKCIITSKYLTSIIVTLQLTALTLITPIRLCLIMSVDGTTDTVRAAQPFPTTL